MATKVKELTEQELYVTLVEAYHRAHGLSEILKPFAIAHQNKKFFETMTPEQRYRWKMLFGDGLYGEFEH